MALLYPDYTCSFLWNDRQEICPTQDENQDGILSPGEFLAAMNLPSVKNFLHSMDVNVRDIGPLFDILDDGSLGENCAQLIPEMGRSGLFGCAPMWAKCVWHRCWVQTYSKANPYYTVILYAAR